MCCYSDISVFETPKDTDPYNPNHNTPVDVCGVVRINAPFCPPTNTPIEVRLCNSCSTTVILY